MGGFSNILGHVATGFEQARQRDVQRQFEDEQVRRNLLSGFLQKLASDETVHPEVRNAAAQAHLGIANVPSGQALKWPKLLQPVHDAAFRAHPRPTQTTTPPPASPLQVGNQSLATPNPPITLSQPPAPPGIYMPPEDVTRMQASRIGAITGAEAGAQAKFPVMQLDPETEQMKQSFVSGTGVPIGGTTENAFNPMAMRGLASIMHPVVVKGPEGTPIPALQNKLTLKIYDQDWNEIPNAQVFSPALVPTVNQGFRQVQQADGSIALVPVTTTAQKVPAPPKSAPKLTEPPAIGGGSKAVRPSIGTPRTVGHTAPPPAMQQKIQEQFQMRGSAIDLIDDITRNKSVLDSLLSSGKIAVAASPDGSGVLSRAANLTDQEAKVAGDFQQLIEHANLLRGPLGATGFRGKEAWGALQAQRGKPMADPRITSQVMQGMRSRLVSLNKADADVLKGQGTGAEAAEPMVGGHRVGDVIPHRNRQSIKITQIYPDGTFDAQPVKAGAK